MREFIAKNRRLSFLLLILIIVVISGVLLPSPKKVSIKLKEIQYQPYATQYTKEKSQLLQKPYMLIEFFTLYCPHCVKNIPILNEIQKNENLSVVGYIMESQGKVIEYANNHNIQFSISRASAEYMDIFEPTMVPMSFIIDTKTLEVKEKIVGRIDPKKLEQYL